MLVPVGVVPFRAEPLPQKSASTYWTKDCVPTSAAESVNLATVDALRPTGTDIRYAAQVTAYRGLSYGEAVVGTITWTTKKGRRVSPTARYAITRAAFKGYADGGYSGSVSISCAVTVNTKRATNDFTGNHTVTWRDYRWCTTAATCYCERKGTTRAAIDHAEILIEDPGTTTTGWQWWSAELLFKAAEFRTGNDGIDVIVFPDTEGVDWRLVKTATVWAAPRTNSQAFVNLPVGRVLNGGRTEVGGNWTRDSDGKTGRGWIQVEYATGKWGWIEGEKAVQAA